MLPLCSVIDQGSLLSLAIARFVPAKHSVDSIQPDSKDY